VGVGSEKIVVLEGTPNFYLGVDYLVLQPCSTGQLPEEWRANFSGEVRDAIVGGNTITFVIENNRNRTVYRYTLDGQKLFDKQVGRCSSVYADSEVVAVAGCLDYNTSLNIRILNGRDGTEVLNKDARAYNAFLLYWTDTSVPGGLFGPKRVYACTSVKVENGTSAFHYFYKDNMGGDWSTGVLLYNATGQRVGGSETFLGQPPAWMDWSNPCPDYTTPASLSAELGGRRYVADNTPLDIKLKVIEGSKEIMTVHFEEPISRVMAVGEDRLLVVSGRTAFIFMPAS
jgi:hypothetical protein